MGYVGITSSNWYNFLCKKKTRGLVNFWRKNTKGINILKNGDLFFFLVKHGDKKIKFIERPILGYGVFRKYETLTPKEAWCKYKENNGSPNFEKFLEDTNNIFHEELSKIGCIILEDVIFFENPVFLSRLDINFNNAIVSGKSITKEETDKILDAIPNLSEKNLKKLFNNIDSVENDEVFNDIIENSEILIEEIAPKEKLDSEQISSIQKWPRDARISKTAIENAEYNCEFDSTHKSFVSRNTGKIYLEAHHLIPMSVQKNFEYSLDVVGNIISLCPNCHKKIHHSKDKDIEIMLEKFYNERKKILEKYGLKITLEKLKKMYSRVEL